MLEYQTAREIRSRAPSVMMLQKDEELAGLKADGLQTI